MTQPILLEQVSISYPGRRSIPAVHDLSFSVASGEIFGFLGPNGAGKTTTIKCLLGLVPAQRGRVLLCGEAPARSRARQRLGYMPETATYYWYLTPRELLRMYAALFGISSGRREAVIGQLLELVGVQQDADRLMQQFSKGMMQKVSLAQALINDPEVLILDEPLSGLDPLARLQMRRVIRDLKDRGKTVFFSSHELSEAELVCDRVAILHQGRLRKLVSMPDVMRLKGQGQSLERYFINVIEAAAGPEAA